MTGYIPDDAVTDHPFTSDGGWGSSCQHMYPGASFGEPGGDPEICGRQSMEHANPGDALSRALITTEPHPYQSKHPLDRYYCTYTKYGENPDDSQHVTCGYPENQHDASTRTVGEGARTAAYPPWGTEAETVELRSWGSDKPINTLPDDAIAIDVDAPLHDGPDTYGKDPSGDDKHQRGPSHLPVRMADVAQYPREAMPDAARGKISVTLVDAPIDPFGTLAAICGIYEGSVRRSKAEVTEVMRNEAWKAMRKTVLSGPLEAMQLTFLIEGLDRAIPHQLVRNRFAFVAQESLRFAVAEDWAAEVALPPALLGRKEDDPLVSMWRRGLNAAEDAYAALVAAGLPAEEARGLLPHAIPTRLFWTVSVRTLLMEAGKRTCTQAQFPWRLIFAGVAKALRERGSTYAEGYYMTDGNGDSGLQTDGWQYGLLAEAIEPVCYQTGKCGFMAAFDRGCTIRRRVDANAEVGRPASEWGTQYDVVDPEETGAFVGLGPQSVVRKLDGRPVFIGAIQRAEWLADPAAARVTEER